MDRKSIFSGLRRREAPAITPGVPSTTDPAAPENQTPKSASWEANIVHAVGRRSLLVPAWYRGVTLLMQTMGQMKLQWQKQNPEGGNFVEDMRGYGRSINWLLQVRPNPLMTASQLQEQIVYRQIYYGNAYILIERDEYGDPLYLWLCTGGGYNPVEDIYWLVYNRDHGPAVTVKAPARDVIHIKNVILDDPMYMGMPVIGFAKKALSIAATADEQTLQDVAKGGRQKVILQEEKANPGTIGILGRVNQDQMKAVRKQFSQDWQSDDIVLLDNVANTQIISQTARDLQLLESRGFEVNDLARILGIPRIMMMEDAGSSYKMPEHATQEFLLRTIQPRIREWEDEFNSKLLTREDFGRRRVHVCPLALRRLDARGQAEIDKLHMETGWSVNEIRAQYDLPAVKDGDLHYVSTNLAELGSEKLRSPKGSDGTDGNSNDNNKKTSQEEEGVEE